MTTVVNIGAFNIIIESQARADKFIEALDRLCCTYEATAEHTYFDYSFD